MLVVECIVIFLWWWSSFPSRVAGECYIPESPGLPTFSHSIGNVTVVAGRDATLVCVIEDLGRHMVAWAHVNRKMVLSLDRSIVVRTNRFSVWSDGCKVWRLHIGAARQEDAGEYMCQLNTEPMLSQKGFLKVVVPPSIDDERSSDSLLVVEESEVARFRCVATGVPAPLITWRRESNGTILSGAVEFAGELVLRMASRKDMGAYLCVANNSVPPTVSKRFVLEVRFPPEVSLLERDISVLSGMDATLKCAIEAHPKGTYKWKVNGSVIRPGDMSVQVSETSHSYRTVSQLVIRKAISQNSGVYTCEAKNSYGNVQDNAELRVVAASADWALTRSHRQKDQLRVKVVQLDQDDEAFFYYGNSRQQQLNRSSYSRSSTGKLRVSGASVPWVAVLISVLWV